MNPETPKKSEASKTGGSKAGGLPDFSELAAATSSPADTGGISDFSLLFSNKQKKAAEAVPVAAASPAKIAIKTTPTVAAVSDSRTKAPTSPKPVVAKPIAASVLEVATEKTEKPAKSEVAEKKSSAETDGLASFREFAAIAGSVGSPVGSTDSGTTPIPAVVKATTPSESIARFPEPTKTPAPSKAVVNAKRTKPAGVFGLTWIPYGSDSMGFAFFAASVHQMYEAFDNGVPLILAVPTILSLAAAGVAMLAVSLALRLLSQIADQSTP